MESQREEHQTPPSREEMEAELQHRLVESETKSPTVNPSDLQRDRLKTESCFGKNTPWNGHTGVIQLYTWECSCSHPPKAKIKV